MVDRRSLFVVRAYAPALLTLLVGFIALWLFWDWQASEWLATLWGIVRWLPMLTLLAGIGLAIATTMRLWRWERGEAPTCPCGGPLGREKQGPSGPYRRCLACSRPVPRASPVQAPE